MKRLIPLLIAIAISVPSLALACEECLISGPEAQANCVWWWWGGSWCVTHSHEGGPGQGMLTTCVAAGSCLVFDIEANPGGPIHADYSESGQSIEIAYSACVAEPGCKFYTDEQQMAKLMVARQPWGALRILAR